MTLWVPVDPPKEDIKICRTCVSWVGSGEKGSILLPHEWWCVYTRLQIAENKLKQIQLLIQDSK